MTPARGFGLGKGSLLWEKPQASSVISQQKAGLLKSCVVLSESLSISELQFLIALASS